MIYIGTSGYSYDDWVGEYYPEGMDKGDFLGYYANDFNCTELNFTYYRMPNPWILERIADKVAEGFLFTVKLNRQMTHDQEDVEDLAALYREYVEAIRPLLEQGKFGCLLAQFPYSFHNTEENRDYLRALPGWLEELPTAVEFRNREWVDDEVFELLREHDLGFVAVDQPQFESLLPPIAEVTSKQVAYVRFHGRNYKKWWHHDEAYERYDYSYSDEELEEWVPKIQEMDAQAEKVFALANNHYKGQSATTAMQLRGLLREAGAAVED